MTTIPWRDHATLIRTRDTAVHDGGRTIVAEALLYQLVELIAALSPAEVAAHFISLPDRQAPPFRYDGVDLPRLIGRIDRPGAFNLLEPRVCRKA